MTASYFISCARKKIMVDDFQFIWWWLLFALPLPILFFLLSRRSNSLAVEALQVTFAQRVERALGTKSFAGAKRSRFTGLSSLLCWLIWLALIIGAARPVFFGEAISLERSGRDLMLAVDVSGSMETQDMQWQGASVTRLQAVKAALNEFIEQRIGDRIGLILFGTQAYVQAPLTFDNVTVRQFLQEASIGIAGEKTAIGDAIGLALKRLHDDSSERVLILLTDGVNNAGAVSPEDSAGWAQEQGMKIYTIGFGSDSMVVQSLFGQRRVNPSAELDEALLAQIALTTGGEYFRARSTQELQEIYQILDELERRSDSDSFYRPQHPLHQYPLGAALALLALLALTGSGLFARS